MNVLMPEDARLTSKEQWEELLNRTDLLPSEDPLPRCSPEIKARFLERLRIVQGNTAGFYYKEVAEVLSPEEFNNLLRRLGIDPPMMAAYQNYHCVLYNSR
jgi:hypothetical protein